MSRRNKLSKFADILAYNNVYENYDPKDPKLIKSEDLEVNLKTKWSSDHFGNSNPITLELACGKGDYALALAKAYPERNFIGVDIKGARIWRGATTAIEEEINNVAFLRTRIEQINLFYAPEEIDEIWITFPDPFLDDNSINRRLTSPNFLVKYQEILKKGGIMHLKTDSRPLYDYTLEALAAFDDATILYQNDDIYASELAYPELVHKTFYEYQHLANGLTSKYIRFTIN